MQQLSDKTAQASDSESLPAHGFGVGEGVGEGVGIGVGDGVGDAVGSGVGLGVGVREVMGVGLGIGVGVGVAKPGSLHCVAGGNQEVTWQERESPVQQGVLPGKTPQASESLKQNGVGIGVGEVLGRGVTEGTGVSPGVGDAVMLAVGVAVEVVLGVGDAPGEATLRQSHEVVAPFSVNNASPLKEPLESKH